MYQMKIYTKYALKLFIAVQYKKKKKILKGNKKSNSFESLKFLFLFKNYLFHK